jgi:dUTP pyrophosphatase
MIKVKYAGKPEYADRFAYQTMGSAGADLVSQENVLIQAGEVVKIRTGVYIDDPTYEHGVMLSSGMIPELQIRMRSSLAYKTKLRMPTAVSTIDCDYPGEITVMLENTGKEPEMILEGDRVAQLIQTEVVHISNVPIKSVVRTGGFGSTNK